MLPFQLKNLLQAVGPTASLIFLGLALVIWAALRVMGAERRS